MENAKVNSHAAHLHVTVVTVPSMDVLQQRLSDSYKALATFDMAGHRLLATVPSNEGATYGGNLFGENDVLEARPIASIYDEGIMFSKAMRCMTGYYEIVYRNTGHLEEPLTNIVNDTDNYTY